MDDYTVKGLWKFSRKLTPTEYSWFVYYLKKFKRLAMNVYEWQGLPETVDPYLIEKYLFEDGRCIIWNDPNFGMVVARCAITKWDAWKKPLMLRPVYDGIPNIMQEISIDDCAFITDLFDYDAKRRDVCVLISELISIQDIIDTQHLNQATPLMAVSGNPKIKDKLMNCIKKIAGGYKVLYLEDDITNSIKPLKLDGPYNVPTLVQYKQNLENEILAYLGIDSKEAYMKKERSLVDEQEANDELLNYMLTDGLRGRQRAIDNNKIGFTATVKVQEFVRPEMIDDKDGNGNFEGEDKDVSSD